MTEIMAKNPIDSFLDEVVPTSNRNPNKGAGGRFVPGNCANPRGRPVGSRQKISEKTITFFSRILCETLEDSNSRDNVENRAEQSLRDLMAEKPGEFWKLAMKFQTQRIENVVADKFDEMSVEDLHQRRIDIEKKMKALESGE